MMVAELDLPYWPLVLAAGVIIACLGWLWVQEIRAQRRDAAEAQARFEADWMRPDRDRRPMERYEMKAVTNDLARRGQGTDGPR